MSRTSKELKRIARENACIAFGYSNCRRAALNACHVDAEATAEVGIGKALPDERAAVADVDIGKVHIADEVIVFATAAQFALVEVVDKLRFDSAQTFAYRFGEIDGYQDKDCQRESHCNDVRIHIDNKSDKET